MSNSSLFSFTDFHRKICGKNQFVLEFEEQIPLHFRDMTIRWFTKASNWLFSKKIGTLKAQRNLIQLNYWLFSKKRKIISWKDKTCRKNSLSFIQKELSKKSYPQLSHVKYIIQKRYSKNVLSTNSRDFSYLTLYNKFFQHITWLITHDFILLW